MVDELGCRLRSFGREASRVRCFAHVINLVVKSIISQFDTPKKKEQSGNRVSKDNAATTGDENDSDLQELLAEIGDLAGDHEDDEMDELDEEDREQDRNDGWIDERRSMLSEELKALERDVLPVRRMLVKVCVSLLVPVGPYYYCWSSFASACALALAVAGRRV